VAVLGVGLLGASFARALRKHSLAEHVSGTGRREENLRRARDLGYIDSYSLSPEEACQDADLVVLAAPVESFTALARKIAPALKKGALLIDVGSVKGRLVRELEGLMPEGVSFVGCHPIAGSERSGIDASSAELFEGAFCVVTPTERTPGEAIEDVVRLWRTLGAQVEVLDPEVHDRVYAVLSHFPHAAAYALAAGAGRLREEHWKFAGQGFLDATRIALSSPELWSNICLLNRENLLACMEAFRSDMDDIRGCLDRSDLEGLKRIFERGQDVRQGLGD
jgi:prephenate dehydrogenase